MEPVQQVQLQPDHPPEPRQLRGHALLVGVRCRPFVRVGACTEDKVVVHVGEPARVQLAVDRLEVRRDAPRHLGSEVDALAQPVAKLTKALGQHDWATWTERLAALERSATQQADALALAAADVHKVGVRLAARDEQLGGGAASTHQPLLAELHRLVAELRELHGTSGLDA